jgi:nitronate monooxygenase
MSSPLRALGVDNPVLAAPLGGGPTTPELVVAATSAGSLGFVAAGYRTVGEVAQQIAAVRTQTPRFGVNLFAPNPVGIDPAAFRRYAEAIQPEADGYGLDLTTAEPIEDDDGWADKVELLLTEPVPIASFTFGIPDPDVVRRLRQAGTLTVQTVTSADEARLAEQAGVDALAVQAHTAGGHWGTMTPGRPPARLALPELIKAVRAVTPLPLIAAGGLAKPGQVVDAVAAGAVAVMVGTALLRSDESGASAVHKAAIADPSRARTVLTRAFTGRPARGLQNRFIDRYDAEAPLGYPAVHHLTSPLRKAAARAGDPELVHLWAGTGYRDAPSGPAAGILSRLSASL